MKTFEAISQLTPAEREEIVQELVDYVAGFVRLHAEQELIEPEVLKFRDAAEMRSHIFWATFDCIEHDEECGYAWKCEEILDRYINADHPKD